MANLVQSELMGRLKAKGLEIEQSPISMKGVADVGRPGGERRDLRQDAQGPLRSVLSSAARTFPRSMKKKAGRSSPATPRRIEKIIDEVIAANPKQVEQYRAGKKTVSAFFVGQVMKASKGQANPQMVNELVAKKLGDETVGGRSSLVVGKIGRG